MPSAGDVFLGANGERGRWAASAAGFEEFKFGEVPVSPTSIADDISHSGVSSVIQKSHQNIQDQIRVLERRLRACEERELADAAIGLERSNEGRENRFPSAESRCTSYETVEEEARHYVIHNPSSDLDDKVTVASDPGNIDGWRKMLKITALLLKDKMKSRPSDSKALMTTDLLLEGKMKGRPSDWKALETDAVKNVDNTKDRPSDRSWRKMLETVSPLPKSEMENRPPDLSRLKGSHPLLQQLLTLQGQSHR